MSMACF